MSMQYTDIFRLSKMKNLVEKKNDIFLTFAQNIDCDLGEAVLTSTHILCFAAKIRKIGIPLQPPVLLYKSSDPR